MYIWGEGTNKDENKSIFWLTKSAGNNEFFAQRDLAFFRATGKLLPMDFEEALYWNFKALSNPVMQNYELAFQKNLLPQVQKDMLNQERNNLVALLTQLIKKLTPAQFNKVMKKTDKDFGQKDIVNIRNESHLELTLPTNWGLVSATHQGILTAYIFIPVDKTLEAYNNDFSFSHTTMPSILPYNQYANLAKVQTQNFECNETKSFNEQSVQDSQGGNYSFEVLCKKGLGYRYILNKMILRDKDLFRLIKIFNIKNENLDSLPKNELTQWRSIMRQSYACSNLSHDCKQTSVKPSIALSRMVLY